MSLSHCQVTLKEVEALLAQSDRMLVDNHYAAPSLRETAWNLRELLEDFSARINEREKTLHEAADFYKTAEKVCGNHFPLSIVFVQMPRSSLPDLSHKNSMHALWPTK